MRQISRLSVIAVSTALLITLSSCSSTQSTLEADDQPSTPTEKREMTTDVPESNNASGKSPQGSVTDTANFEIAENEDGTVIISRYIGSETDIVIPLQIGGKTVSAIGNVTGTTGAFEGCTSITAVVIPDGVTEIQDNELEVSRQAEKIYEILISDDPEMELEKYYDIAPNSNCYTQDRKSVV